MSTCRLVLDADFAIAPVERRLFGSFVEHMGRCVYTGIYEPGHPTADEHGLRGDVLALTRELGVTVVRYPGGNFVSGYDWQDGVGPVADRPTRLDLAWRSVEPNEFGLHEFVRWARLAGVEPMYAVNLGTRGVAEAAAIVEYANHPGGTAWSDLRRRNGAADPFGIRLWCLGNEMDGPWQVGQKTATEYGRLAAEAGKAMRLVDPTIELVACGSSNRAMPTFASWEAEVLDHAYDVSDYISLHTYYERAGDLEGYLYSNVDMDRFIDAVVAVADYVGARRRSPKRLRLSFDEWNAWDQAANRARPPRDWEHAPRLIEDAYDIADAVVVGGCLITLLRHADRVGVACQAQLANIIAPILTEPGGPAWRQSIFHPFAAISSLARGQVLRLTPMGPRVETDRHGEASVVDAVATWDEERGRLALFAVNRSVTETIELEIDARGFPALRHVSGTVLAGEQGVVNTADAPDAVVPVPLTGARIEGGRVSAALPPLSWTALKVA